MAEITEKDLPGLIERLKHFAKTKGLIKDEVDDFSQEAAFQLYRGRKATFGQLYVEFLRKTYGDTRSPGHVEKSRSTLFYSNFDENLLRGDRGDGLPDREATRCITQVCEVLDLDQSIAIAMMGDVKPYTVSQGRWSQLKKSATAKMQEYLDYQHAYHLMETEELWINWITI